MTEVLGFEARFAVAELRESKPRVVVVEAGQARKRFELPHRLDPWPEKAPASISPGDDGERELGAPEQEQAEGREELVAAGVEKVCQTHKMTANQVYQIKWRVTQMLGGKLKELLAGAK